MYICGDGGTAYLGNSNCNNNVSVVLGDDCLGPTNYAIGITTITISITITLHYITLLLFMHYYYCYHHYYYS